MKRLSTMSLMAASALSVAGLSQAQLTLQPLTSFGGGGGWV